MFECSFLKMISLSPVESPMNKYCAQCKLQRLLPKHSLWIQWEVNVQALTVSFRSCQQMIIQLCMWNPVIFPMLTRNADLKYLSFLECPQTLLIRQLLLRELDDGWVEAIVHALLKDDSQYCCGVCLHQDFSQILQFFHFAPFDWCNVIFC